MFEKVVAAVFVSSLSESCELSPDLLLLHRTQDLSSDRRRRWSVARRCPVLCARDGV